MGYTFTIGNAVPQFDTSDFPHLSAQFIVEGAAHEHAPVFPNDTLTANTNMRSPSYSVWEDFCRATGLYDLFFNESGNLIAGHPGCIGITREDADRVTAALRHYRTHATLPPGFEKEWGYKGEPNYDGHLARLIWLEYWMQWAVDHCEIPAIQNT